MIAESLLSLFSIIHTLLFAFFVISALAGVPFLLYKFASRNRIRKPEKVYIILPIVCLLISGAAYIFNMGWIRLIFTVFGIAPLYAVLFLASSFYAADCMKEDRPIRVYTIISYVTFSLTYMLLPDGGDYGEEYFFFSPVRGSEFSSIAFLLAMLCAIVGFIFIVLSFFRTRKLKKQYRESLAEPDKTE